MVNCISPNSELFLIDKLRNISINNVDKDFLKDINLELFVIENENSYTIEGSFPNFNNYELDLTYTSDFLSLVFCNKNLYDKKNTISINDYGTFRRMFYLENININNIKLNFDNSIFQLLIEKL